MATTTTTLTTADKLIKSCQSSLESSDNLWNNTGSLIIEHETRLNQPDLDKKGMASTFAEVLDESVDPNLIPEEGPDRKGEIIILRKKGNAIKWSSWRVTARMVQNTSDIWKAVEVIGWDAVFPKGVLIARPALLKALEDAKESSEESSVDTIIRCLEMAQKKLDSIEATPENLGSIEQRLIEFTMAFNDLSS